MLCPVDDSELKAASFGGYQIHRCPQCLGASVNGTVLRDVRAYVALELHRQQGTAASVRPCPKDATAMKTLSYKGLVMCACPQCLGLWLDAGQLSRLLEMAGPPKQTDLSTFRDSLATIRSNSSCGPLDGVGDIMEFAADVLDSIGKLTD